MTRQSVFLLSDNIQYEKNVIRAKSIVKNAFVRYDEHNLING